MNIVKEKNLVTPIYDITPYTLLDYPTKIAAILWFAGCPLRCMYCHNSDMIKAKGRFSLQESLKFLQTRQGLLNGVVLSGGECSGYHDLKEYCFQIKQLGYAIKLDTSGVYPEMIDALVKAHVIDDIALDIKALDYNYYHITGKNYYESFVRTAQSLLKQNFPVTFRTTLYPEMMDENDVNAIVYTLYSWGYRGVYTLQKAQTSVKTLGNLPPSTKEFDKSRIIPWVNINFLGFGS